MAFSCTAVRSNKSFNNMNSDAMVTWTVCITSLLSTRSVTLTVPPLQRAASWHVGCDAERAGIVDLHRDVQTCGYHDVEVMWGMLGLDAGPPSAPERRNRSPPFWTWTPSFWHLGSSRRTPTPAAR